MRVKNEFPILRERHPNGKPLVYLDSAATSQKPQVVIDAIVEYYQHDNANVHRGVHFLGDRSTRDWLDARQVIASFFGARPEELIAVRNATEGLNLVAYSLGERRVGRGDSILATQMEHHSNLVPWQQLALRTGASLDLIPVTADGQLDLVWLRDALRDGSTVKVVAVSHVSNTLGTINPLDSIAELLREYADRTGEKPLFVVDGAQAAPHMPVHFSSLEVDFYAVSAHKMLGPMGIGGVLVRREVLTTLQPWLFGGGMIAQVGDAQATFAEDMVDRFTPGTPDVAGLVGWAAACEYLRDLGMSEVWQHDQMLVQYALEKLAEIPEITIVGPTNGPRCGSVAFIYEGVHAHDVAQILDSEGVAVRSGHHCTMPLHKHMGWVATTRMSFNVYTEKEDIDAAIAALHKVPTIMRRV